MADGAPPVRIALIGDRDPTVTAHRAIPIALELAGASLGIAVEPEWHPTSALAEATRVADALRSSEGIWCVPATPYASTAGALAAIRHARERGVPFLGTCGGFQYAMVEYAQNALGIASAAHAELDPSAPDPVIAPLECALVEKTGTIHLEPGSLAISSYGSTEIVEGYHCRYGLSPRVAARLDGSPLRVTGRDPIGDVRVVELGGHPFFVCTLFQPERAALTGRTPPLVLAFVAAALATRAAAAATA